MAKLEWDKVGEHYYETGISNVVLYLRDQAGNYSEGYAWSGVTSVSEAPSGAESTPQYADNQKYLTLISAEEFGLTIEAFTYPNEFDECNGEFETATGVRIGQQKRSTFGLSYRTKVGDDVNGQDTHYKLHLAYGCTAAPSERAYATVNESPEAMSFSWEISTNPENVTGKKPTSLITIDSREADPAKLNQLEDLLYGTANKEASMPSPDEVIALFSAASGAALEPTD